MKRYIPKRSKTNGIPYPFFPFVVDAAQINSKDCEFIPVFCPSFRLIRNDGIVGADLMTITIDRNLVEVFDGDYLVRDNFGIFSIMCPEEFKDTYEEID